MMSSSKLKNLGVTLLVTSSLVGGMISASHADDGSSNPPANTASTGSSGLRSFGGFFKHLFSSNLAISTVDSSAPAQNVNQPAVNPAPLNVAPLQPVVQTPVQAPIQLPAQLSGQLPAQAPSQPVAVQTIFVLAPTPAMAPRPAASIDRHKHEAIIFGGVDNEETQTSIFRDPFVSIATALKQNNWEVQVLFGGRRSCANCGTTFSVDPIAAALGVDSSQIQKASIEQLEAKLDDANAKLTQGDELLLHINTHGIIGINPAGETSVSLAVYDESDPTGAIEGQIENGRQHGAMLIDDPALTQRFQSLKDKGVKIAISDDSCFGGPAALRLEKYGCVLTQTSDKYGLGSPISDSYVSELNASSSDLGPVLVGSSGEATMEDIFLDALSRSTVGINSPYYTTPYAGVLEPQFSGTIDQYTSIQNLSSGWLLNLKSSYLGIKNGKMSLNGSTSELSGLENYSNQYLAPFVDASKDSAYLAIAQHYMKKNNMYIEPGEILTPSQLAKTLANLGQSFQNVADQYNQLVQQEQVLQANIQQSGFDMKIQLPSDYSDGQSAFDNAVQALNGKQLYNFSGWLTYPVYSDRLMAFFDPSDLRFKTNIIFGVMSISQQMAAAYPAATSSDFKNQMNAAIENAETQAWNTASADQKNALRGIQQIIELKKQEQGLLSQGGGAKIVSYGILARMYSYLALRDRAGQSNGDVNACANFNLRAL